MSASTFKKDLYDYLIADVGVGAALGNRIFAHVAPTANTTFPYVTIQRVSQIGEHHLLNASTLQRPVFQLDVWAESSIDAEVGSEALREALDGFAGTMGGTNVRRIFLENQQDIFEDPDDGSETITVRTRMDFEIWLNQDAPSN